MAVGLLLGFSLSIAVFFGVYLCAHWLGGAYEYYIPKSGKTSWMFTTPLAISLVSWTIGFLIDVWLFLFLCPIILAACYFGADVGTDSYLNLKRRRKQAQTATNNNNLQGHNTPPPVLLQAPPQAAPGTPTNHSTNNGTPSQTLQRNQDG